MPAVINMHRQPPAITRAEGLNSLEPAILALIIPVAKRPNMVNSTMLTAAAPGVGAKAPRKGIRPPAVKLSVEARAAYTGRAFVLECCPNSSLKWAASGSCRCNSWATFKDKSCERPRSIYI